MTGRSQERESIVDDDLEEGEEYDDESPLEDEELGAGGEVMNGAEIEGPIELDPEGNEEEVSEEEADEMVEGDMEDDGVDEEEDELMQDRGIYTLFLTLALFSSIY